MRAPKKIRFVVTRCFPGRQRTASAREAADKLAGSSCGWCCELYRHKIVDLAAEENAPKDLGWE
jgi:hypothetical protein